METKNIELFVEDMEAVEDVDTGIITISGYANRYKDEEGQLVVDRSTESVLPSGYDLSAFKKNPILLYQHDKSRPIGKIIAVELRPDGLYVEANVHKMMDPQAHYAVAQGILKTFSIGFMVKDYQEVDDIYFWTEVELLEISIVSVPDNQESLFNVLTNSPCNNGKCILASKATKSDNREEVKEQHKEWSSIDKSVMLDEINDLADTDIIEDAYLIVKDVEKSATWKFPHHQFDSEKKELVLHKGGLMSALSALKGAKDEESHSLDSKLEAAKHLEKHFNELLENGTVDNIPSDLTELVKYFEEKQMETKDEGTPPEGTDEQPPADDTINTPEHTEEGNPPQDPEPQGDGESPNEPDGTKVTSIEDVTAFIADASKSSDGLNTLLNLYASLETSINEALPKLLDDEEQD